MEMIGSMIAKLDGWLWGFPLVILLLGTHIYFTFRLKFIQRYTFLGIKLSVQKDPDATGNVSPLGALSVALASTIGTGNIVGVATAVTLGGPGAVFWCWLTGVFGIATKFAESLMSVKYRKTCEDGKVHGGPMYAMLHGFKNITAGKICAVMFCIFTIFAGFGIGNLTQSNAVATIVNETFHIPTWIIGVIVAILIGGVVLGGIKAIANVCTAIVPFMALVYVIGCIWILCINHAFLLEAVKLIISCAFAPQAAVGGFAGGAVMLAARYGVARGLFSNESGMGSAPIVAASAQTRNPVRQALISSTGTFWDTVIICAMTGLVVVSTVLADPSIDFTNNALLTQVAFNKIPYIGKYVLAFGIFSFASTTILGWFYYSQEALYFLNKNKTVLLIYKIVFVCLIVFGATRSVQVVWDFADLANGLMVIPNVIALFVLQKVIAGECKKYLWNGGLDKFDPDCMSTAKKNDDEEEEVLKNTHYRNGRILVNLLNYGCFVAFAVLIIGTLFRMEKHFWELSAWAYCGKIWVRFGIAILFIKIAVQALNALFDIADNSFKDDKK